MMDWFSYCSFAYSALASFRMGTFGSVFFPKRDYISTLIRASPVLFAASPNTWTISSSALVRLACFWNSGERSYNWTRMIEGPKRTNRTFALLRSKNVRGKQMVRVIVTVVVTLALLALSKYEFHADLRLDQIVF